MCVYKEYPKYQPNWIAIGVNFEASNITNERGERDRRLFLKIERDRRLVDDG